MKKFKYGYAVLTTAALLTFGSVFTSFAGEWNNDDGQWVYVENNGETAKDTWKEIDGQSYYLGSDGVMLANSLINVNESYYYVRSNGAMVKNEWRFIQNPAWQGDDLVDEGSWYYFGDNGRAYVSKDSKATVYTIGGKKYIFDSYGRMMTGWITESGERVEEEENWQEGLYYADTEGDGDIVTSAWVYASVVDDDNEDDNNPTYHFYFASNGKKTTNVEDKNIDGKKYTFDDRGVAATKWKLDSDGESWKYYGTEDDECALATGWFQAVPDEAMDSSGNSDGSTYWYYGGSTGKIAEGCFKSIDGKTYAFKANGEMLTGLKVITVDENDSKKITSYTSVDYLSNIPSDDGTGLSQVYLLDSSNGAVQTGTKTVEIDGTNYTFSFKSNGSPKGAGLTGLDDGYIYDHGRRLTAEEDTKVQIVSWDDKDYLVNENGVIQKNKKNTKDADGYYYCTDKSGVVIHGPLSDKCTEKH